MANHIVGFSQITNPLCLLLGLLGTFLGIFFGTSSGMTSSMRITLALPLIYSMGIASGTSLFLGVYIGNISRGLITAILTSIPGTPASVVTTPNGHSMALRGEESRVIRAGALYSFLGGMVSLATLFSISPILAKWVFKFSYEEHFSTAVLFLLLIFSLSGKSIVKGLASALIGVMSTTIGVAPVDMVQRYTSGLTSLGGGLKLLPLVIGIYAVAGVLRVAAASGQGDMKPLSYKSKRLGVTQEEFREQFKSFTVSSLLRVGIGILLDLGVVIPSLVTYSTSKEMSRYPKHYGAGCIGGLIVPEAADDAVSEEALIPPLTMGIPGDADTTILLAAFTLKGITPDPLPFDTYSDVIHITFAILIVANIMILLIQIYGLPVFLKLLSIPRSILFPVVMVLASIGTFAMSNRILDVWSILFFAIVRYGPNQSEFPPIPIMPGFVLDPIIEPSFHGDTTSSYETFFSFFTRPISGTVLVFTILLFITQTVRTIRTRQKTKINS